MLANHIKAPARVAAASINRPILVPAPTSRNVFARATSSAPAAAAQATTTTTTTQKPAPASQPSQPVAEPQASTEQVPQKVANQETNGRIIIRKDSEQRYKQVLGTLLGKLRTKPGYAFINVNNEDPAHAYVTFKTIAIASRIMMTEKPDQIVEVVLSKDKTVTRAPSGSEQQQQPRRTRVSVTVRGKPADLSAPIDTQNGFWVSSRKVSKEKPLLAVPSTEPQKLAAAIAASFKAGDEEVYVLSGAKSTYAAMKGIFLARQAYKRDANQDMYLYVLPCEDALTNQQPVQPSRGALKYLLRTKPLPPKAEAPKTASPAASPKADSPKSTKPAAAPKAGSPKSAEPAAAPKA